MKLVTTEQMRELDRLTIEKTGTSGKVLMDRAGRGVADVVLSMTRMPGGSGLTVLMFAGRGNNGGDVFAAARHLAADGATVRVWLAGTENDVRGDAFWHLSKMKEADVGVTEVLTKDDWEALSFEQEGDVLVDGILGTGVRGPARGPAVGAIQTLNNLADGRHVVAIDIPSGLNADTGEPMGDTVRADITVTIGLPKQGLAAAAARDYVGSLEVVDIGIPAEFVYDTPASLQLITADDLKPCFKRRGAASHKGTFGHALIVGGSRAFSGAAVMATRAAVRAGSGLVTAAVPRSIFGVVAASVPEAMIHATDETGTGGISAASLEEWWPAHGPFNAVLVGPGMTADDDTRAIVEKILSESGGPLVLDADALNVLAGNTSAIQSSERAIVITPHPGEMARLLGCGIDEVQQDRLSTAQRAVEETGTTVVLKGAGTIVAAPGENLWVNSTGNPGMATGGMGDVLAGILVSLLAQGITPFDAARAAVYLHGHAGDSVAWRTSQAGLTAGDVIDELPYTFRSVAPR